jgi:hypothetical protein
MKKISIVLFSVILALSASAQKRVIVRPIVPVGPRIVYYSHPYWNPYFYGGFGYSWYNRPVYYYHHQTKLDKQIQNIEDDYSDRISSVRADDSLSGHQRRVKVRELKRERDQAIDDLRKNYYKQYEN